MIEITPIIILYIWWHLLGEEKKGQWKELIINIGFLLITTNSKNCVQKSKIFAPEKQTD